MTSLSNFKQVLKEIISVEFLETLDEFWKWNPKPIGRGREERWMEEGAVLGLLRKGKSWVRLRLALVVDLVRTRCSSWGC